MTASVAASATPSPFAQAAPSLAALGFSCLPLIPFDVMHHRGRGKAPGAYLSGGWRGMDGWERYRDTPLNSFDLKLALAAPGANVGVVLGTVARPGFYLIAIDVDVTDPDALDTIVRCLPASPMRKRGAKGVTNFYAAPKSIGSRSFDDHRIPRNSGIPRRLVDVLTGFAAKQTVCPPSIHPDGPVYEWLAGPVPANELPVFDDDAMTVLEETLQQFGYDPEAARGGRGERKPYMPPPAGTMTGDAFDEAKAAALENLSAWVPHLENVHGLRPARGGYEAVSLMRDSSTGQPLHKRKRNLSIQRNGITDFGTGETFSAIDLVAYHNGLTISEALAWLEDKLGLGGDNGVVIDLKPPVALGVMGNPMSDPDDDLPEPLRPKPSAPKPAEIAPQSAKTPGNTEFEAGAEAPPLESRRTRPPARVLDLSSWTANRLTGEPPETRWLVRDAIPAAIPGMVAAQGDAGKSMVLLDLARRVAFGSSPLEGPCFGGMIEREGTCVVITAEDDAPAIHRRIANLDPSNARYSAKGERLIVVPLPDAGGPLPLVTMGRNGPEATDAYKRLEDQLAAISDLQMVVLDPLQAFVLAPINEDPAAGQFACSMFATLAAETQANVMVAHHVRKSASERGQKQAMDLQGARELIRGTTALVDGLRWAYAFWPEAVSPARAACQRLGVEYQPNRVIMGGIVKANGPVRRRISTYIRNDVGLLVDQTMMLSEAPTDRQEQMKTLAQVVEAAAKAGAPFTRHGQTGLDEQRHRLPPILQDLGRDKLRKVAEDALKRGLIVGCIAKGSTAAKWLDVPDGPIAQGVGEFSLGAVPDAKAAA